MRNVTLYIHSTWALQLEFRIDFKLSYKQNNCNTNRKDPLTIQLLRLKEIPLKFHPKMGHTSEDKGERVHRRETSYEQGSEDWKMARKGKVTGSRAACALG